MHYVKVYCDDNARSCHCLVPLLEQANLSNPTGHWMTGWHIELDSEGLFFCRKEPGLFSLAASQLQTIATMLQTTNSLSVHNIHRQETVTAFSPIIMPFTRSMACEVRMKTWSWTQTWLFAWAINYTDMLVDSAGFRWVSWPQHV